MKENKRTNRKDLETPPGEFVDRELKASEQRKKRIMTTCPWCGSPHIRILQRPNIYRCVVCRKRFMKSK